MGTFNESLNSVRMTVQGWLSKNYDGVNPQTASVPPKEKSKEVAGYVRTLWEESKRWRKTSLQGRFVNNGEKFDDPLKFWGLCRKLEAGSHWEVWGSRKKRPEDNWKHELVDDEIANQIRAKVAYLTANWHDIEIVPNIQNISEIVDQERDKSDWGQTIKEGVKKMKIEGSVHFKTILDLSKSRDGIAREIVADNASIFPTPYATGLLKTEGTWYLCYATTQTVQQVKANPRYRDLDWDGVAYVNQDDAREMSMQQDSEGHSYAHTRLVDVIECYLDDPRQEPAPIDPQETDTEHAAIHEGIPIAVHPDQNHFGHIQAHMNWLNDVASQAESPTATPEDVGFVNNVTEYTKAHIEDHMKEYQKNEEDGISKNKRLKYPFGRRITVIGGEVAEDDPNPFQFDWRELWTKIDNEKVVGHYWGRGDVEILWNTNKTEDIMLSRAADSTLSTSLPKQWMHLDDQDNAKEGSNDPTQVGFYTVSPPVFRQGEPVPELFKLYSTMKEISTKQLGVGDVTYGGSPTANASGDLVELLIKQNTIQVTGEANVNLNDGVRLIVQTRLKIYKQFYKEPRYYYINGGFVAKNVSRMLTIQTVKDDQGNPVGEKEIPMFDITIKPNSNFPMEWEKNLAFFIRLAGTMSPDGTPYIPREFILNMISERFPELGTDGKYYQMSQATAVGQRVIAQQQAMAQAKQKDETNAVQKAKSAFQAKALSTAMNPQPASSSPGLQPQETPQPTNGAQ